MSKILGFRFLRHESKKSCINIMFFFCGIKLSTAVGTMSRDIHSQNSKDIITVLSRRELTNLLYASDNDDPVAAAREGISGGS